MTDNYAHTGAHPTIVARIVEDMNSMATLIDNAHAETFIADEPWAALQRLLESLEAIAREAERQRPSVHDG